MISSADSRNPILIIICVGTRNAPAISITTNPPNDWKSSAKSPIRKKNVIPPSQIVQKIRLIMSNCNFRRMTDPLSSDFIVPRTMGDCLAFKLAHGDPMG